jgi:hypothetical protein
MDVHAARQQLILMFRRMLRPDSRQVDVNTRSGPRVHLKLWAVRVGAQVLNVLLINKRRAETIRGAGGEYSASIRGQSAAMLTVRIDAAAAGG